MAIHQFLLDLVLRRPVPRVGSGAEGPAAEVGAGESPTRIFLKSIMRAVTGVIEGMAASSPPLAGVARSIAAQLDLLALHLDRFTFWPSSLGAAL